MAYVPVPKDLTKVKTKALWVAPMAKGNFGLINDYLSPVLDDIYLYCYVQ